MNENFHILYFKIRENLRKSRNGREGGQEEELEVGQRVSIKEVFDRRKHIHF